eukprot:11444563-Alexandrium_andersonii.AAC.1
MPRATACASALQASAAVAHAGAQRAAHSGCHKVKHKQHEVVALLFSSASCCEARQKKHSPRPAALRE